MTNESKWKNEFPTKYKELFENYKNIEMFQNIYDDIPKNNDIEEIIEGFSFTTKFDMHKNRGVLSNNSGYSKFIAFLKKIIDYILCPFYKSDELIDKGIQTLFKAFLYNQCGDDNSKKSNTMNVDLSQLIDERLLYFEKFQNKEGLANRQKVDCSKRNTPEQQKELKNISKTLREQIYKIIFLPLVFHIFYNCYFMFCFKDEFGGYPKFIDVETVYFDPIIKPYLNYFFGIIIKPLSWLYYYVNWLSVSETWRSWTDKYPYIFYLSFFSIVFGIISVMGKNAVYFIYKILSGKAFNVFTNGFISLIIAYEFIKAFIKEIPDWIPTLIPVNIGGIIYFLLYWIIRIIINVLLDRIGLSAYLCNMYVAVYLLFGIYISQEKDVFEVYKDIDHSVYKKIYELFNSTCDSWNSLFSMATFYYVLQMFTKHSVLFLTEITIFIILFYGYVSYSKNIRDINVKSFLYILNFTSAFLLCSWIVIKYNDAVKKLDKKYDYVVKELARKINKTEKGGDNKVVGNEEVGEERDEIRERDEIQERDEIEEEKRFNMI